MGEEHLFSMSKDVLRLMMMLMICKEDGTEITGHGVVRKENT
jgi:hypothetical protein